MDSAVQAAGGQFELTEDQRAIQAMAEAFAEERVAPNALDWDRERHFPADVIRETGPLGLGGIYIRDDVGGSALGRLDAVLVFEALVCPRAGDLIEAFMPERVDERENLACLPALRLGDGHAEQPLEGRVQLQV